MPPTTAADYFGGMVASYDSLIRRAVPRYDEMTDRLLQHLPTRADRIVELGCGTGNLTLRLVQCFPGAHITTLDAAPEMTAVTLARARSLPNPAHITALTTSFEDAAFPGALFDLAVSCMSLHHVPGQAALYRRLHDWLAPGGVLAFADQLRGQTNRAQQAHWDLWLAFCREPGHCTPDEIRSLEDHAAAHDHYVPLSEHFRLLTEAGFTDPDCAWRNGMYSVVLAHR
jgi:trans-aconitate methyltransferase